MLDYSVDKSDALAWRELMRDTDPNLDNALQRAWENWRERESRNGRPNRAVSDVDRDD